MSQDASQVAMQAAIDWMVLLQSGTADSGSQQRLQRWLDTAPEHRQAWQQLQEIQGRFQRLRDVAQRHPGQEQQARELLLRPSRRVALRSLAALAVTAGGAALWTDRQFPLRELGADFRTATAQRRRFALTDGSSLVLDARSAVDAAFDGVRRQLWLRRGRALLEAVADPRPVLLHSLHAQLTLLRGQLMIERDESRTIATVLGEHALIQDSNGQALRLQAGHSARVDATGITALSTDPLQLSQWLHGRVSLDNAPLQELVERLRPYRSGFLRVSPSAAMLRVQGVFALDESQRTLAALAETLPVSIQSYGPVTLIDRK
ncbi:hypothetical protein ABB26_06265 [Stenotrophomonas humi]|uniref:Iron dicitrate transport regulator FecR n=1 Tax=Stenotrophomonas humi TaxID=405444 RepID=A0A0R0C654_9GAMM|nr:DUF4880 domain-containing protein [Stenotrophomonas humi]KRG64949.1 hypothetical protein ABB26_06265 [Stenotrophomonas humi]